MWEYSKEIWASLVAQMVKNPPTMWETWVPSLSWDDPLEEGMTVHSSILAWRIPWTEELQSIEVQSRTRMKQLSTQHARSYYRSFIGYFH